MPRTRSKPDLQGEDTPPDGRARPHFQRASAPWRDAPTERHLTTGRPSANSINTARANRLHQGPQLRRHLSQSICGGVATTRRRPLQEENTRRCLRHPFSGNRHPWHGNNMRKDTPRSNRCGCAQPTARSLTSGRTWPGRWRQRGKRGTPGDFGATRAALLPSVAPHAQHAQSNGRELFVRATSHLAQHTSTQPKVHKPIALKRTSVHTSAGCWW